MKRLIVWLLAIASVVLILVFGLSHRSTGKAALPFHDNFRDKNAAGWEPYGGSWRFANDGIFVSSMERGAKLVTGSPRWADYQVTADLQLYGPEGDLGVAVRVENPSVGIDSYLGYYVGLRLDDSAIILGKSGQHWLAIPAVHMDGGVRNQQWYRLHIVAVGCRIAVETTNLSTHQTSYAGLLDDSGTCLRTGRVALRSTNGVGEWRDVDIQTATASDLAPLVSKIPEFYKPAYPIYERDFSAMRENYLRNIPPSDVGRSMSGGAVEDQLRTFEDAELISISSLRSYVWSDSPVRIAGVITSADPLYIQDSSGGVHLQATKSPHFQTGEEAELLGHPVLENGRVAFDPLNDRIVSNRVPIPAIALSATQAASGSYDGSFVELAGKVLERREDHAGEELLLRDGAQVFTVRYSPDIFSGSSRSIEVGARIRARGICVMSDGSQANKGAFTLYADSPSNLVQTAGPPWWTGERLIALMCSVVLLGALGVYTFVSFERSKIRLVHEERERLSHEIHDTLAQNLVGVGYKLQGIRRSMRESATTSADILAEMDTTCEMIVASHRDASASIAALHPASQHEGDLLTLLERAAYALLDGYDIEVSLERSGERRSLSPVVLDALFRVGREAIANVLRHSQATTIRLSLQFRPRDLILSVADNGQGFVYDPSNPGFGLQSMARRCQEIKARLEIETVPGRGCIVRITAPYRAHAVLSRWIG